MGVYFYVNSYKKNKESIITKNESLGLYEVYLDDIEPHTINDSIEFWDSIYCFEELSKGKWCELSSNDIFISKLSIVYFDIVPSSITGDNIIIKNDKTIGNMFSPEPLLELVNTILDNQDWLIDSFSSYTRTRIIETEELYKLNQFKELLEKSIENDLIIGMSFN